MENQLPKIDWVFQTIQFDAKRNVQLTNLSLEQTVRVDEYRRALETAKKSAVADPIFSNYFVKGGIGNLGGKMLETGNIEYGFCQALHCEESAIAVFRSCYGKEDADKPDICRKIILGSISGSPGNIATPCGNCRDIMSEKWGVNLEIVSGAPEGGIAVVTNLSHYLFSGFQKLAIPKIPRIIKERAIITVEEGEFLTNDAYSPPQIHLERRYYALITTKTNNFFGGRDVMCDYHPIYALRDAIRQARRENDPFMQSVIIVCEDFGGGAPQVMYKDRQHLMELNLQAELLTGKEKDPPIYLITLLPNTETITGAWKTSVKEWLPLPFSSRNFGPEFLEHQKTYYKNKKLKRQ